MFFDAIAQDIWASFAIYCLIALLLLLVTIPIVRKVKAKIKEIYGLLSKVSHNEKKRYFKHFRHLYEEFRSHDGTHEQLNHLLAVFDARGTGKNFDRQSQAASEEDIVRTNSKSSNELELAENEDSISEDRGVYFQIGGNFFVLAAGLVAYFLFVDYLSNIQR
jgi:hypothetical protein